MMRTILLVDDEEISLRGMKNLIPWGRWQCSLLGAVRSGQEALDFLSRTLADIVITDIRMPGMDGLELIQQIQRQYPTVRFIIISAYGEFEYAKQAMRYGVLDFLLKPVGISEIEEALFRLTDGDAEPKTPGDASQSTENIAGDGDLPSPPTIASTSLDPAVFVKNAMVPLLLNDWTSVEKLLLGFFKDMKAKGVQVEEGRNLCLLVVFALIEEDSVNFDKGILQRAAEIGSAQTLNALYLILKEQLIMIRNNGGDRITSGMNHNIQKVLIFISSNYRKSGLNLKWISEHVVYMRTDYLGKLFFQETGKHFSDYLAEFRIAKAKELFSSGYKGTLNGIAQKVGYGENVSYFIQQFKKVAGMTPLDYASRAVVD
jgi:two-component system response regulator YesN